KSLLNRLLLLTVTRDQAGNRAPRNLDFYIVGFHPQHEGVVIADGNNRADNTPAGQHGGAVLQLLQHFLLLLPLTLHGQEQQEVEDGKDEDDGQESQQGIGRRRSL